jgi:predicted RNA-binding protein with PUA-like domain
MGIAKVARESYPDPTTDDPAWVVVDLKPVKSLKVPVTLEQIKSHPKLKEISLIKQSRLSVMPLTQSEYKIILEMGKTKE